MYILRTWKAGDYIVIKKSHQRGAEGKKRPRGKKEAETSEAAARYNLKMKTERIQMLIMANFVPGDLFITLTYAKEKRPADLKEAKKDFSVFMRRLKDRMKKKGADLKWIVTTEVGSRGACHHHLVINYVPGILEAIREFWDHSNTPKIEHLYEDGAFRKLAEYMAKVGEDKKAGRYSRSRNLIVPGMKEELVEADTWQEEPRAKKGYIVLKDSIENGVNPFTGSRYQRYVMQSSPGWRTNEKKRDHKAAGKLP